MYSFSQLSSLRRFAFAGAAALLAVGVANAQFTPSPSSSHATTVSATDSSSNDYQALTDSPDAAEPAAPAAAGQYDNNGGGGGSHGILSRLTFEAGGGFNSPIGNDGPYITWGGNFTGGAGVRFSKRISILGEFQYIDDKLPGAFVAAGGGESGNAHIISITADPTFDLFPKRNNSAYIVVGGGFYHKSTNFNIQECCDFYGYPVNVTANSFTSNQGGVNGGIGITHRFGGMYNDGTMKVFAEARYVYINTPGLSTTDGLGTTGLIPVTFGVRW